MRVMISNIFKVENVESIMSMSNGLTNSALDYCQRDEAFRNEFRGMSEDYLKGRIDQYIENPF